MKRRAILALIAACVVLGSCAPVDLAPEEDDRLEVTEKLRTACPRYTDLEIETTLTIIESERTAGIAKDEMIDRGLIACTSELDGDECLVCLVAMINQVYGDDQ